MTKPHEETWFVEADGPEVEVHRVGGSVCDLNGPHARTPDDLARARLIAQAPAMARLLLSLEWTNGAQPRALGGAAAGDPFCSSCGGHRYPSGGRTDYGHHADCELAAVLRAAGVLP